MLPPDQCAMCFQLLDLLRISTYYRLTCKALAETVAGHTSGDPTGKYLTDQPQMMVITAAHGSFLLLPEQNRPVIVNQVFIMKCKGKQAAILLYKVMEYFPFSLHLCHVSYIFPWPLLLLLILHVQVEISITNFSLGQLLTSVRLSISKGLLPIYRGV